MDTSIIVVSPGDAVLRKDVQRRGGDSQIMSLPRAQEQGMVAETHRIGEGVSDGVVDLDAFQIRSS